MKIKEFIGVILMIGGIIGIIACGIASVVFMVKNPDMTDMRRLIEYPDPAIWIIICYACTHIGITMIGAKKRY